MAYVSCYHCGHQCDSEVDCTNCGGMKEGDRECPICRRRPSFVSDPFGHTKYIRAYPTKFQSEAFLAGVRACGVTSEFVIEEIPDRLSPTGCWFQIMRAPVPDQIDSAKGVPR